MNTVTSVLKSCAGGLERCSTRSIVAVEISKQSPVGAGCCRCLNLKSVRTTQTGLRLSNCSRKFRHLQTSPNSATAPWSNLPRYRNTFHPICHKQRQDSRKPSSNQPAVLL